MSHVKKIVVAVDDEVSMEDIFKIRLKNEIRSGLIDFHFFDKAKDCLAFIGEKENSIHIVLLLSDINMPEMNGLNLLEAIKSHYPKIKVYMATAYDTEDYRSRAQALGAEGYLVKPIDFEEVKRVINQAV